MKIKSRDYNEYPQKTVIYTAAPLINIPFRHNLLSIQTPTFGWKLTDIFKLIFFLSRKISSREFKKFPASQKELQLQLDTTMELYELSMRKESEKEKGKTSKAQQLFYRPKLDSKNDTQIYERLERRASASEYDRRNNKI